MIFKIDITGSSISYNIPILLFNLSLNTYIIKMKLSSKINARSIKKIMNTELVWMAEETTSYTWRIKILLVSDTHMNVAKI